MLHHPSPRSLVEVLPWSRPGRSARLGVLVAWLAIVHGVPAHAAPWHEGPPPFEVTAGEPSDPLHVGLGARVWIRGEVRSESRVVPTRTSAHVEARWRGLRSFVQLLQVRQWGSAPEQGTNTSIGLHQGYLELSGQRGAASGFVRVGRQQYALGSWRVLAPGPWSARLRSLDALRLHGAHGPFSFDVSGALLRQPETLELVDDQGAPFSRRHAGEGLLAVAMRAQAHRAFDLEGYALLRNYAPSSDDPQRRRIVFSPGARVLGNPWRGLHYELEGYVQSGRWDGMPHAAWLGALSLDYRWTRGPRGQAGGGYTTASGGGSDRLGDEVGSRGGTHRDFDDLLGARDRFHGFSNLFAPTNVHDGWVGFRLMPGGWAEFLVDLHHFALYDPTGRWVRADGSLVGTSPDNRQRTVGEEVDLRVSLHPWGPLMLQVGYSIFIPTGAGRPWVGPRPLHLGYLVTELTF